MNFSGGNFETGFGDGTNAAEMLRDSVDLQHRSVHRLRDQERRQRQALVYFTIGHGRCFFGHYAPLPAKPRPDTDQATRRVHHEADKDQPEPEQPVGRPDRKQFAEKDEKKCAKRGAEHVVHAADHHHRQQLAGKRHRDRFGRDQVSLETEQRAGQSGALLGFQTFLVSAEAVSVPFSGELLAMVVIGGMHNMLGPALGALFFILFRELFSIWSSDWLLWFGLIFVGFVMYSPGGLVSIWARLSRQWRVVPEEAAAMTNRKIYEGLPLLLRALRAIAG